MAVDQQAWPFTRAAAESQDRLDVSLLRQQDARAWLDRVVKAQCGAEVRIERLKRRWLGPFGVEDRQNMSNAPALVAVEFVEFHKWSASGKRERS